MNLYLTLTVTTVVAGKPFRDIEWMILFGAKSTSKKYQRVDMREMREMWLNLNGGPERALIRSTSYH
jgi:hypothetical protein